MFFSKLITVPGGQAALVIEYSGGTITSINYYCQQVTGYDSLNGKIQPLAENGGFKNATPSSHEAIHAEFGRLLNVDAEITKTHHTHFHWVGKVSLETDLLIKLKMAKVLTMGEVKNFYSGTETSETAAAATTT
jgi:hypothetical protein